MRDFDKNPYTEDEQRVAQFFFDKCGIGGGDDPIGALLVSHEYLAAERNRLRAVVLRYLDFAKDVTVSPVAPELKPIRDAMREVIRGAGE